MYTENEPLLLTFDIGTTAVKVCLFSIAGEPSFFYAEL